MVFVRERTRPRPLRRKRKRSVELVVHTNRSPEILVQAEPAIAGGFRVVGGPDVGECERFLLFDRYRAVGVGQRIGATRIEHPSGGRRLDREFVVGDAADDAHVHPEEIGAEVEHALELLVGRPVLLRNHVVEQPQAALLERQPLPTVHQVLLPALADADVAGDDDQGRLPARVRRCPPRRLHPLVVAVGMANPILSADLAISFLGKHEHIAHAGCIERMHVVERQRAEELLGRLADEVDGRGRHIQTATLRVMQRHNIGDVLRKQAVLPLLMLQLRLRPPLFEDADPRPDDAGIDPIGNSRSRDLHGNAPPVLRS